MLLIFDSESNHIRNCADLNKLILNLDKTSEKVFRCPTAHWAQHFHLPPFVEDIEQLDCNKLFGVIS